MKRVLLGSMAFCGLAVGVSAADWGGVGIISDTVGINANRLCIGAASASRPSDFGCPADAPLLIGSGLSVSGIVTATHFEGDGSRLTGVGASDRITSGTTNVVANQDRSVTINTAGSARVTVGENGNVGIGTSSPNAKFEVNGTVRLGGTAANAITDYYSTAGSLRGSLWTDGTDFTVASAGGSAGLIFRTNGANRGKWDSNGNLGIGTTAPSSALQVSGTFTVSSTVTNANPALYVSTTGRVGIGTSNLTGTPHSGLFINDSNVNNSPGVSFATAGVERGSIAVNPSFMTLSNVAASGLRFANANGTLLTVSGAGNVGIGTSTPSATLSIATVDTLTRPAIALRNTGSGLFGFDIDIEQQSIGRFDLYSVSNGTRTARISVDRTTGNVGIGTTAPSRTLHVAGTVLTTSWTGINLSSAGNVTPTAPLEVSGTISATEIKLSTTNSPCTAEKYGTMRYEPSSGRFFMCMP